MKNIEPIHIKTEDELKKSSGLEYTIRLGVGDIWKDGHGMNKDVYIRSCINAKDVEKYYKAGCKIVGFDLKEKVATEYEDRRIYKQHLDSLIIKGFELEKLDDYVDWGDEGDKVFGSAFLSVETFVEIFMFIVGLGFKEDCYCEYVWDFYFHDVPRIEIGGYGLFTK